MYFPALDGGVHQGVDRENFLTDLYLRIHSTKNVSFIYAMLMSSVYVSNIKR